MSWPYSPQECPRCRFFERADPPALDYAGYEVVGACLNPRIAMDLFALQQRDPETMAPCPCFRSRRKGDGRPCSRRGVYDRPTEQRDAMKLA